MKIKLYIIKGLTNEKHYVGITNNILRRLQEHASGVTKGGQVIGEFKLIYTEEFTDYATARMREKFLKSGQGRKWIKENITETRPAKGG
jgi:putative endonuclease